MRLPLFVTTLLLGTLQSLPMKALSPDLSGLSHQESTVISEVDTIVERQNNLVAGRPRSKSRATSQTQSAPRSSKRRSQSSTTRTPARKTTRRAQPKATTPSRAVRSRPSKVIRTKRRTVQPKTQSKPTVRRKPVVKAPVAQPKVRKIRTAPSKAVVPEKARPAVRQSQKRPPSSPAIKKTQLKPASASKKPTAKIITPKSRRKTVRTTVPSVVKTKKRRPTSTPGKGGNGATRKVNGKGRTTPVKTRVKPAVTVKKGRDRVRVKPSKVRSRPRPLHHSKIRRKGVNYRRRRVLRRQRYDNNRYWGNRRVRTRRLTRAYRPCYYCPGLGWSYSPTCYTRPSRYYIYSDSLSYWPSITTYRRSSRSQSSRSQQLIDQVEIAIRDYADLYDLNTLNDDIEVAQEGSIVILTGVVDKEETLEDLIAIARDIDGVKYVVADDVIIRELEEDSELPFEEDAIDSGVEAYQEEVIDVGVDLSREEVIDLGIDLPREEVIDLGIDIPREEVIDLGDLSQEDSRNLDGSSTKESFSALESQIESTDYSPLLEAEDLLENGLDDTSNLTLEFASVEDFLPSDRLLSQSP